MLPFGGSTRPEGRGAAPERSAPGPVEAIDLFRRIARTRAAEAQLVRLADEGRIRQAPRRAAFREAGPIGSALALRRASDGTGDVFAPTFRAAGALSLFGIDLDAFFRAHLHGKVGPARDSGAELHLVDLERGLFAPVVPLGLLVEVVGGLTLGTRMLGQDRVGLVCDTDGATSTGAWHEGLVVAAARKSPMVLIVEASADPARARKHTRLHSYTGKAAGYGVAAQSVSGADAMAVIEAVGRAVTAARAGEGVQMVEIRYDGDPLDVLRDRIVTSGSTSADELDEIEVRSRSACHDAVERVSAEAFPGDPDTLDEVYAGGARIPRRIWAGPVSTQVV